MGDLTSGVIIMEYPELSTGMEQLTAHPPVTVSKSRRDEKLSGTLFVPYLVLTSLLAVFLVLDFLTTGFIIRSGGLAVSTYLMALTGSGAVLTLVKGGALVFCLGTAMWSDRFLKGSGLLMAAVVTGWYGIILLNKLNLVMDMTLAG